MRGRPGRSAGIWAGAVMALPTDQVLTKFRLLRDAAQRDVDAANSLRQAAQARCDRWAQAYRDRCRDLGFCPFCEAKLGDCRGHVFQAFALEAEPAE